MNTKQNLSNGHTATMNAKQKKAYMKLIWEGITPDNIFGAVARIQRISRGAKLKPSEQLIINQIK